MDFLTTIALRLSPQGFVTVPLMGKTPEEMAEILSSPEVEMRIGGALKDFAQFIEAQGQD
jgi:hypothetical protein